MQQHGTKAYLLNTGWSGGAYGVGKRISIKNSRAIINAILSGEIDRAPSIVMPYFNFKVPTALPGVDSHILAPKNTWADQAAYEQTLKQLVTRFIDHFKMFENTDIGKQIKKAGPV
jgi:phosphoenolpyruvate carboxykinase (ATP)